MVRALGFRSLMELERMDGMDGPYPLDCTTTRTRAVLTRDRETKTLLSGVFACGADHFPGDDRYFLWQRLLLGDHPHHLHDGHDLGLLRALLQPRHRAR